MTIEHLQCPRLHACSQMARCVQIRLKVINTVPSLPSFRAPSPESLHINCPESISRENDLAIWTEDCLWSRTLSLTLCGVVSRIGDGSLESSCVLSSSWLRDIACVRIIAGDWRGQPRHQTLEAWDTQTWHKDTWPQLYTARGLLHPRLTVMSGH